MTVAATYLHPSPKIFTGNSGIDDFYLIQDAINRYATVVLGSGLEDSFSLSQPVYLKTGTRLIINGTVKLQDGFLLDLIEDAPSGQLYVDIDNADAYFSAGQWVCVSDDNSLFAGGSVAGVRDHNVGDSVVVDSVTSTRVTFKSDLYFSYTTAANAKIGHLQSCFIADTVNDWVVEGDGIIDANSSTMYNVEPVGDYNHPYREEVLTGACIATDSCDNFTIKGILAKNGGLHNFVLLAATTFNLCNIKSINTHDKSVLVWSSSNGLIENLFINSSRYEDGLTLYAANSNIRLSNIYAHDCPRANIHFVSSNSNITGSNITASGVGYGIIMAASKGINLTNVNIFDSLLCVALTLCEDITFNNVLLDCSHAANGGGFSIGAVKNVIINGGMIKDGYSSSSAGRGIFITGAANGIYIHNLSLRNLKRAEEVETGAQNIHYFNLAFSDNFNDGNQSNATVHDCVFN